jgi:predicted 3-demethylubiquinone-9 3-methyltransferase (glyoxalase superfamily)/predicted transcriptional regulator YdeE
MSNTQRVTPFLMFNADIGEVIAFYKTVFPELIDEGGGTILLHGQRVHLFNGGPHFTFSEGFSFMVLCDTQAEIDAHWTQLTADGGEPGRCGWLKDKYGLSWQIVPSKLQRLLGDPDPAKSKRAIDAMLAMNKLDIAALEGAHAGVVSGAPRIEHKAAFTVAGLRIRTRPKAPEIGQLWDRFVPRSDEIAHNADAPNSFGLMGNRDDAAGMMDYMAGLAVSSADALPAGMETWPVPAADYAVFTTNIKVIGQAFDHAFGVWLPASDYQAATSPCFERYGADFMPGDGTLTIWIPVVKRGG